jgi:hypothetical protein
VNEQRILEERLGFSIGEGPVLEWMGLSRHEDIFNFSVVHHTGRVGWITLEHNGPNLECIDFYPHGMPDEDTPHHPTKGIGSAVLYLALGKTASKTEAEQFKYIGPTPDALDFLKQTQLRGAYGSVYGTPLPDAIENLQAYLAKKGHLP